MDFGIILLKEPNLMSKPETKLQIPLSKKLKKDLDKKCESMGFYSSNDVVRFMIQNFVDGQWGINMNLPGSHQFIDQEYVEELTGEAEESLGRSLEDVKHGRVYTLDPTDPKSLARLLSDDE